jgi:hypothetical protein
VVEVVLLFLSIVPSNGSEELEEIKIVELSFDWTLKS